MRLDTEVLFNVIPKYLRDGWQVVCSDNLVSGIAYLTLM